MALSTATTTKPSSRVDINVLYAIAEYRYATVQQIMLHNDYSLASPARVYESLAKLTRDGYLYKQAVADTSPGGKLGIWSLTSKGKAYMGQRAAILKANMEGDTERQQLFLEHIIAVNDLLVAFRRFEKRNHPQVTINALVPDFVLKKEPIVQMVEGKRIALVADGWLEIRAWKRQYNFWLEVDRGTENRKEWNDKIAGIVQYAESIGDTYPMRALIVAQPNDRRRYPLAAIRQWTAEKLAHMGRQAWGELFRFAESPEPTEDVHGYFTYPKWSRAFDDELIPLIAAPMEEAY
jgi:DNA-binding PadR family transcriptional regulator